MADAADDAPSPYRVSTITWNGSVSCPISNALFFDELRLETDPTAPGFIWTDFHGIRSRGEYPKRRPKKKTPEAAESAGPQRRAFDNQTTVMYRLAEGYYPNVKLFNNGGVHITGIRCPEDGVRINEALVAEIRRIHAYCPEILGAPPADIAACVAAGFKIRMINSDFRVPYRIRRKDLHRLLMSREYGNKSVFQPGSYPGVKLQYFWNAANTQRDGICRCAGKCLGKGAEGECKKITIAIFESGSVLITGSNALHQVDEAYAFITRILATHPELRKPASAS